MGNFLASKDPVAEQHRHYVHRLTIFYKYWNPAKLVNSTHVEDLLSKYAGREEELLSTLVQKYGPEPAMQDRGSSSTTNAPRKNSEEISNALHEALRNKSALGLSKPDNPVAAERCDDTGDTVSAEHKLSRTQDGSGKASTASNSERIGSDDAAALPRPSNFLGDTEQDISERVEFMKRLAELRLPMPQNEAHFHASRIYMDDLDKSVYDPEQWIDYLKVKGYKL